MSTPKTLLQLAGFEPKPGPLSESALVLIDCQMEYVDGLVPLSGIDAALAEGEKLIAYARDNKVPVVHIQHKGRAGGAFDPDGPSFRIADAVAPVDGEAIVEKALPNSFAGTPLDDVLKDLGVKEIIVAGFMSHMCVSSTARASIDRGLRCTIVANACATRDLPDGQGGVIAAADLHRATMAALADRFGAVVADTDALAGSQQA